MSNQPEQVTINGWLIDQTLLEKKSITRCEIAQCKGGCCADGVWVDMGQARLILEHAELIMPYMPAERRDVASWFAEHYDDDPAFPSGEYIGTTTVVDTAHPGGTTCVFLRPEDHYCAIQAASIANGRQAWELKPHYCCLYPLVDEYDIEAGTKILQLDSGNTLFDHGGGCYRECATTEHVFQVYAEETAMVLGIGGYKELCNQVGTEAKLPSG